MELPYPIDGNRLLRRHAGASLPALARLAEALAEHLLHPHFPYQPGSIGTPPQAKLPMDLCNHSGSLDCQALVVPTQLQTG